MYFAGKITGFNLKTLMTRGVNSSLSSVKCSPPNWEYSSSIWDPLIDTIKMSLLGSLLGSILVIPFAIIASSNIVKNKIIISLSRLFLSVVRTLPTLVTALIATYIFGLRYNSWYICDCDIYICIYCGKQLYEQIETVDMALRSCRSTRATKGRSILNAIFLRFYPGYIASSLYCFEGRRSLRFNSWVCWCRWYRDYLKRKPWDGVNIAMSVWILVILFFTGSYYRVLVTIYVLN